jgi:type II secretory pathway component GspD/PulD (secretin)
MGRVDHVASNRRVRDAQGRIPGRTSLAEPALRELPEGTIDPFVRTVTFSAADKPLVRLHYYATHPQVKYNDGIAGSSITEGRTTPFIDPKTLITAGAFPAGAVGLSLFGAFGDTIDAYVRAFEESRNFKVLSRPSVFTSNNKKATIVSGRRVPVPTQSITDVSTGNTNTSINFEDVVLKLEVIPLINADNEVTLQIAQQNDSIVDTQTVDDNEIPVIGTQEVNTTVKVRNNNTVILGGLIEDTANRTEGGVPILKDIPLLGYLFKTTNVSRPRNELIVMIQPRVIGQGESETLKSEEEAKRYMIAPDAQDLSEKIEPVRTQLKRPKAPRGLEPAKQ